MAERGYPFDIGGQASLELGQDEETLALMAAANFSYLHIGIETPDKNVLTRMNKRQNLRTPMLESLENIKSSGVAVLGSMIIGYDDESAGADKRICSFIEESDIPIALPHMLRVLPETKLWERLNEEGRLVKNGDGPHSSVSLNYVPKRPETDILEEFTNVWDYLFEPRRYLRRAYRYFVTMKVNENIIQLRTQTTGKGNTKRYGIATSDRFAPLVTLLNTVWKQGIKSRYRFQFWRQLFGMTLRNPSQLVPYLKTCVLGETLFNFRRWIVGQRSSHNSDEHDNQPH
jgi:radical SAM superfamily enzyme YgiQ (UPF0313 family)